MGWVAKIRLLLASYFSPFRHPFGSPFANQNAPKIPFWLTLGALGSEFSSSVANTFSQCFSKACPGLHFHEKTSKREGGIGGGHCPYIVPPPPSHTLPPCCAKTVQAELSGIYTCTQAMTGKLGNTLFLSFQS